MYPCTNPLKLLGRRDFFFSRDEAGFVQGEGGERGEEKQIFEVFLLSSPILVLTSACLYELKYEMADNWSDVGYYIEKMMRIPVWVLYSSPRAGLLIQNSFSEIQCAHLATINTACLSHHAPPNKVGSPVEIYVCKRESTVDGTELQVSWSLAVAAQNGNTWGWHGVFYFPMEDWILCSIFHTWRQKNHCLTNYG